MGRRAADDRGEYQEDGAESARVVARALVEAETGEHEVMGRPVAAHRPDAQIASRPEGASVVAPDPRSLRDGFRRLADRYDGDLVSESFEEPGPPREPPRGPAPLRAHGARRQGSPAARAPPSRLSPIRKLVERRPVNVSCVTGLSMNVGASWSAKRSLDVRITCSWLQGGRGKRPHRAS